MLLTVATYARTRPEHPAVIMGSTGEVVTYADLDRRSIQLARALRAAGCKVGDHIALVMETHPRFSEVLWAAHRIGLHYTPVNVQLTVAEAAHIVADCGATVVVTSAAQRAKADLLRPHCPGVRTWIDVDADGPDGYEALLARQSDAPLEDETEGSAMIYSSGTTGRPKGIKRPRSGKPPGSSLFGVDPAVADAYGLDASSVALIPLPLYHSSGLTRLMMTQSMGATAVLMVKFDPEQALAIIERHRVTLGLWVATMLLRLLRLDEETKARYDLSSMVAATLGSGPCPPAVKRAIIDWWGPIVTEVYGGTEGNGLTRITSTEWLAHPGSVGRPVFGEIHIIGPGGEELGANRAGVIYFSGGRPFEYYNDPAKTSTVYMGEGWSTLGDVGYVDEEGYLYITDRVADMIISGGVNIYPREIEEALLGHPDVDDVAVFGVPNEEFGEEVKAVVKPRPGVAADDDLRAALLEHCRASLAGYKCPRSFDFVDELPRQDTGKLYKRMLRDRYWAGHQTKVV